MNRRAIVQLQLLLVLAASGPAFGAAPGWLKTAISAPMPAQGPDVDAVQLLNEVELVVTPDGKMVRRVRSAVRILRVGGQSRAEVRVMEDAWHSLKDLHGWQIPSKGKPVELRTRDAVETSVTDSSQAITDRRLKVLQFRNASPGDVVAFEYEVAANPLNLADTFGVQDTIPVREARYSLKLPPGWNMLPSWINLPGVQATTPAPQQWVWTVKDVPLVRQEVSMPAWTSVVGHLYLTFSPPTKVPQLSTWAGIGGWFVDLSKERRVASDGIRSKVAELVAGKTTDLERMRALTSFLQREVRYVAILLGIGGYQPHAAPEVFQLRYGDCKDKATLLAVMLDQIGIQSIPVLVNSERSYARADTPANMFQFNHVILAIRLPDELEDSSLLATVEQDGRRLLIFDPTDEITPLGRIRGQLQGGVGLLSLAENSRLITLPQLAPDQSGIRRTARFVLSEQGVLAGEVKEKITGQEALNQRGFMRSSNRESDKTRVVEARLSESLASFQLVNATARNRDAFDLPLEWDYRISAPSYARRAGDLLMVRPRVLGVNAFLLPEGRPRVYDLLISESRINQDEVIIDLPAGYVVDTLPPPVELDAGFATYRSRTEVTGSQLKYTRTYEVRTLTVPVARIGEYNRMQNEIARDERAVVVLKKAAGT